MALELPPVHLPDGENCRGVRIVDRGKSEHSSAELAAVFPAVLEPLQQAVFVSVPAPNKS